MLGFLARKIFGTSNDRIIKSLKSDIDKINAFEPAMQNLSDDELCAQTVKFRARLENGEKLDDLLHEAFATVREAAKRVLGQRHFDVQLMGGIILHRGMVVEMRTGEGKTLTMTLAVYLNALEAKGMHVVTVNDYLVKRDAQWMGKIYRFLGLGVGCIVGGMHDVERQEAYRQDITYGTNNEFGFDYLRDNMKYNLDHMVQRKFHYAIVDEVDSILIDEARTPLVISGPTDHNSDLYVKIDKIIPKLDETCYEIDEKSRNASLTEEGNNLIEKLLKSAGLIEEDDNLYSMSAISVLHHVNQALKAHLLYKLDVNYLVQNNVVYIIDEFTGRVMEGRRYAEGLHQAIEAKEGVPIQNENQTLASITYQNYFRMYPKLAGMTGTAMTEAHEFQEIYNLQVVSIPTHLPVQRVDMDDEIYRNAGEKSHAILNLIKEVNITGQPILIGTISIEKSEELSKMLEKHGIKHSVLNAKYHEQEAEIIAQAGRVGAVTIATNMAGRGTDIMLGGNLEMLIKQSTSKLDDAAEISSISARITEEYQIEKQKVQEAGGLFVICTERHESRRIDDQLRGRSGRQGDPGRTKFFLSLEDDLMRIFGTDRIGGMLTKLGLKEGEAIIHPWISQSLKRAQQKVEAHNYDIRKNLLKYDDVMNEQRREIYKQRIDIMNADNVYLGIENMIQNTLEELLKNYLKISNYHEEWDVEAFEHEIFAIFDLKMHFRDLIDEKEIDEENITKTVKDFIINYYNDRRNRYDGDLINTAEKRIMLIVLDHMWKEHLLALDHLRQGIYLRAYAQKDPLNEYKNEAFSMFSKMIDLLSRNIIEHLFRLDIRFNQETQNILSQDFEPSQKQTATHEEASLNNVIDLQEARKNIMKNMQQKVDDNPSESDDIFSNVSRNSACPCGSGKKFKYCHGSTSA